MLVVDDEAEIRTVLSALLRKTCEVLEAADGEKALEIIRGEHPMIVLLDVSMPKMSGIKVLEAAKAIDPGMLVIMITAERDIELARRALDLGASEFITKPFDVDYVRNEIKRLTRVSKKQEEAAYRPWRIAPGQAESEA